MFFRNDELTSYYSFSFDILGFHFYDVRFTSSRGEDYADTVTKEERLGAGEAISYRLYVSST